MVTNDGNAILREIMVKHPAAKSMIEISRTQDEECGDGTTSVIILAGEVCVEFLVILETIKKSRQIMIVIYYYCKGLVKGHSKAPRVQQVQH